MKKQMGKEYKWLYSINLGQILEELLNIMKYDCQKYYNILPV